MYTDLMSFEAARAQAVLEDCRSALVALRQEPRGVHWRLAWCATLALLRAVGHVLQKDGSSPDAAPEFKAAASDWWRELKRTKPEPAIFWQFIDDDRNALLKEYRFTAEQVSRRRGGAFGTSPFGSAPFGAGIEEATYLMKVGPFAGRDQRDLVEEAIGWWDAQLDEINTEAMTRRVDKML